MVAKRNYLAQDEAAAEFEDSMVRVIRALGLHKPDETPCGQPISVAEAHAMLEIAHSPGITQNALASRLHVDKSTVSRIVAMLVRRQWIQRKRDAVDGRLYHLQLSAKGRSANQNIAQSRRTKFARVLDAVPAAKRGALLDSLTHLVEALGEK